VSYRRQYIGGNIASLILTRSSLNRSTTLSPLRAKRVKPPNY
jgi:hypothetical protein